MEKAAFPVSSLVLQPNLHSHPNQERRGFEFHCAINQPLESGTDNEAGAASKDAVSGAEFQLVPMGGSFELDFFPNANEFDKTNREINKQQTIRPDYRKYFITSAFLTKTFKLNLIPVFPLRRSKKDKNHFR